MAEEVTLKVGETVTGGGGCGGPYKSDGNDDGGDRRLWRLTGDDGEKMVSE
ncbi:hypothetical protein HanRHA438_Chr06g0277311 [Helianthus annuus]|nr:hypothetical protein HanIR_Chr06g0288331 [Helianthus annuus]KAJ0912702.1 hypothetical protein HanRHA438_Chr06g0277311 [Helianthus annuus]